MGDQNAPERRWKATTEGSVRAVPMFSGPPLDPGESVEVIEVAALTRAIAERDAAVRDGLEVANALRVERDEERAEADWLRGRYRAVISLADRYREAIVAYLSDEYYDDYRDRLGRSTSLGDASAQRLLAALAEGEQPAGECPGCRDTGIRIGALESPTVTCDCEAGAREDARWTASAAGEQSTTETATEVHVLLDSDNFPLNVYTDKRRVGDAYRRGGRRGLAIVTLPLDTRAAAPATPEGPDA